MLADLGLPVLYGAGRRQLNEHLPRLEVKISRAPEPVPVEPVVHARVQHAETVADAALQVDRRRVGRIAGRARHFADPRSSGDGLDDDLVVEDEIVGVALDRQASEQPAAEGAQAGVVFGQFLAKRNILYEREKPVRDVLVPGHAASDGVLRQNARAQHHVVLAVGDHGRHRGYQQRRVLVVRVHHDDDVRSQPECLPVAGLLIPPVALVELVTDRLQAEFTGERDGLVAAGVIDEHDLVNDLGVKLGYRSRKCRLRVIGGQHDGYSTGINHAGHFMLGSCGLAILSKSLTLVLVRALLLPAEHGDHPIA